ncbi:MAG: ATP synthase F1 subunit delta [Saprospiraceae bacterium]|nr:ATP synthase F1 subunit delta [Saprospiraceae bacterium]HMW38274.1 ATP synthase F1 subunit delta [Saprospiraceae bacterium]HMX88541.1 ATP synthase F1 subunit delta [Saprospiraceae bacterium]HMZ40562.1 ATP synthase F1 subunit delta [Saprospiraceae bacterium]HNA64095.1 ATP synthase F1 subunit delta [Saprospiraceae bacterium]
MSLSKIAGRYAKSLIDLSIEKNVLEEVYENVGLIAEASGHKELSQMYKSPVITADKKIKIIQALFGQHTNRLTQEFLEILINKGRESLIPAICNAFINQYKSLKKIRPAKLICAIPMTDSEVTKIKAKFQSWLQPGETMELSQEINTAIIGGYIFQMEGRQVDATVKRSLEQMKSGLFDTSYTNLVIKS